MCRYNNMEFLSITEMSPLSEAKIGFSLTDTRLNFNRNPGITTKIRISTTKIERKG